jgi:hypothetical protein
LTRRCESSRCTLIDNATTHPRNDANDARKSSATIDEIAESPCAAIVSAIDVHIDLHAAHVIATQEGRLKARCADSESQFLATKKFSCPPASSLIGARQNQFFERIAQSDSQSEFAPRDAASIVTGDRCTLARAPNDARRSCRRQLTRRSDTEFGFEQIVDGLRIGLAAR